MKKIIIFLIILLLFTSGCKNNYNKSDLKSEDFSLIYTTDDDINIYSSIDVIYFNDNYVGISLSHALNEKILSVDNLISKLRYVSSLNDGGSQYYKYISDDKTFGDKDFFLIKCNSLLENGNLKDIFITANFEELNGVCSKK